MAIDDRIRELITPGIADLDPDIEIVDVEYAGGILRVTIDVEGGISVGHIQRASRAVSAIMDEHDPISSAYSLEVSSPGVERRLRRPEHFVRAVGEAVSIKLIAHTPAAERGRRFAGDLLRADDDSITVDVNDGSGERTVSLDEIERAKTVFEWGPAPKPGKGTKNTRSKKKAATAGDGKNAPKKAKKNTADTSTPTDAPDADQATASQTTRAGTP